MWNADCSAGKGHRMRRSVFDIAATVSFLLCAATVLLWVRSYTTRIAWTFHRHGTPYALAARQGHMGIDNRDWVLTFSTARKNRLYALIAQYRTLPARTPEDFETRTIRKAEIASVNAWTSPPLVWHYIPIWPATACFAILPTTCLWSIRKRRFRLSMGHCLNCNHNLTGNTSGVCPECGTAIPLHPHSQYVSRP
jgi:hypothetical protein